jgi:uncharacterized protein YjaZ
MSIRIHILSASPRLKKYQKALQEVTRQTIQRVKRSIPIRDVDIVLYENPWGALKENGGIGGYAPTAHTVLISLDPAHPRFAKAVYGELRGTLAHELHHTVRWRKPGYGVTLLEAMITEGLADHFDHEMTGANPRPWSIALSASQRARMFRKAQKEFQRKSYDHQAWFLGSQGTKIPRWTGYALGYDLVGKYLKRHTEKRASQLYAMPATEFLK